MASSSRDIYASEINSTDLDIARIENNLFNWTIPKQNINNIYDEDNYFTKMLKAPFESKVKYSIKTTEQTVALNQENESVRLLSEKVIFELKKKYNYIHIGYKTII